MALAGQVIRAGLMTSGTYIPVLLGRSPDTAIGVWSRIDSLVNFWAHFLWDGNDSSGDTVSISLPFEADASLPSGSGGSTETMVIGSGWARASTASATEMVAIRLHTPTTVALNRSGTNATLGAPDAGGWTNIRVHGAYLTSAPMHAVPG